METVFVVCVTDQLSVSWPSADGSSVWAAAATAAAAAAATTAAAAAAAAAGHEWVQPAGTAPVLQPHPAATAARRPHTATLHAATPTPTAGKRDHNSHNALLEERQGTC